MVVYVQGFVYMDNDNHWSMYFDDIEMPRTNNMNDDVVDVDFNPISYLQEQIKMHMKLEALIILCMVAYGLKVLHVLTKTRNFILEFVPQKERCRQELISHLVHIERCCDIIHTWVQKHLFSYVNE